MRPKRRSVVFAMPWPPSANRIWRVGKGRAHLSKEAREYRDAVLWSVIENAIPRYPLCGRLEVSAIAHPPDNGVHDLDNLWKAPLDALKHAGVIEDDRLIVSLYSCKRSVVEGGRFSVIVTEIEGEE